VAFHHDVVTHYPEDTSWRDVSAVRSRETNAFRANGENLVKRGLVKVQMLVLGDRRIKCYHCVTSPWILNI